jgi:hypothetical protein
MTMPSCAGLWSLDRIFVVHLCSVSMALEDHHQRIGGVTDLFASAALATGSGQIGHALRTMLASGFTG